MNDTLEQTRRMASDAMERASSRVKDLRSGMGDMASRGMGAMTDSASAARRYATEYASAGTRYVADHPMKSALIAAAIGAAVAGIVIAMRHRRDSDRYF